jgi:hypothetical protein
MWRVVAMSLSKVQKSKVIEMVDSSTSVVRTAFSTGSFGVVVGEIVRLDPDGTIAVEYPDNSCGPLRARTLIEDVSLGAKVLLAFETGIPTLPIILGLVHDRAKVVGRSISLKADRIILEAKDELLLKCGEGGLEAKRNGTVHLKGKDVISRATRTNKVRGATVLIN